MSTMNPIFTDMPFKDLTKITQNLIQFFCSFLFTFAHFGHFRAFALSCQHWVYSQCVWHDMYLHDVRSPIRWSCDVIRRWDPITWHGLNPMGTQSRCHAAISRNGPIGSVNEIHKLLSYFHSDWLFHAIFSGNNLKAMSLCLVYASTKWMNEQLEFATLEYTTNLLSCNE